MVKHKFMDLPIEGMHCASCVLSVNKTFEKIEGVEFNNEDNKYYSLVLYWIDRTREFEYVKKYNDSRVLNTIVLIDNYEDITKGLPQQAISSISSSIDQLISKWVSENNGTYRKLEKDRYYILFENVNIC